MKCPRCGAEINPKSKFCEACGSQISYRMQREQENLNKAGCPKCHSSNIQFRRETHGEIRGKRSKQIIHLTVGFCKDCGYTWYPNIENDIPKKNNTIWWILGWLFFFPIPVMILIWRKKNKWSPTIKIIVTIVFWILVLIIGSSRDKNTASKTESSSKTIPAATEQRIEPVQNAVSNNSDNFNSNLLIVPTEINASTDIEESVLLIGPSTEENEQKATELPPANDLIDGFVNAFNSSSGVPLIFAERFTPSDKGSRHYRVEFRLNAYKNATGKSYSFGNETVDIISRESIFHDNYLRIYLSSSSFEKCLEMVQIASPILDETLSTSELQTTIDYLNKNKEANGYYYSNLGILLLGNDTKGYSLMLKMKGD